ncbi:hypothetical protein BDN72DRAFT_169728 [Pluteus cervinus]|uniref:Uncharacterized protein n=1 Tax=Pluteus cervinus TaxID=181527 RepID=A0ACD3B773_9AGAR|nr:hypothetical protein BDN72DRAFT_169728 [Pluteus cervinus]
MPNLADSSFPSSAPPNSTPWTARFRPSTQPSAAAIIASSSPPTLPPLYNLDEDSPDYCPFLIFGFLITTEKLLAWADKYNLRPDGSEWARESAAWSRIQCIPWGRPRVGQVFDLDGNSVRCFMLATNKNTRALGYTKNLHEIYDYYVWLGEDVNPGWYPYDEKCED